MTLVFAVMHLYNILDFFIASVHSFFILFFLNLVLINRRNGPRYQRVLVLCFFVFLFFLTGSIPKGLILRKFCALCLCMFCLCKFVSGLSLWFLENLCFDDLCAE